MARFQLGSIITRISGSIGGSTFRRVGSVDVVSNKSSGATRNVLLQNSSLFNIRSVVIAWQLLSLELRKDWSALSALHPVRDKFGNMKTLTGRQFFIKYNSQLSIIKPPKTDPKGFSTLVNSVSSNYFTFSSSSEKMHYSYNIGSSPIFLCLKVFRVSSYDNIVPINRTKFLYVKNVTISNIVDLTAIVEERFGNISADQKYVLQVYCMNAFGVRVFVESLQCEVVA